MVRMLGPKRKVGILTFSDGRRFAHERQYDVTRSFQERLVNALEATGEVECVTGEIVWTSELARSEAQRLAAARVDLTIFNFAVWAFPTSRRSPPALRSWPLPALQQREPAVLGHGGDARLGRRARRDG